MQFPGFETLKTGIFRYATFFSGRRKYFFPFQRWQCLHLICKSVFFDKPFAFLYSKSNTFFSLIYTAIVIVQFFHPNFFLQNCSWFDFQNLSFSERNIIQKNVTFKHFFSNSFFLINKIFQKCCLELKMEAQKTSF